MMLIRVVSMVKLLRKEVIDDTWVNLEFDDGQIWEVSRRQIGPIGIGEALQRCQELGFALPSPAEVDVIWQCADVKIPPMTRTFKRWTAEEMGSEEVMADQIQKIQDYIGCTQYELIAGEYKDVVSQDGKVGLYGWHTLRGKPVQTFYSKHALAWKDYSQGLRYLRKRILNVIP